MGVLYHQTPVGTLYLRDLDGALTELRFCHAPAENDETPLLREAADQLNGYFAGSLRAFSLPLAPFGTPFQRRCWDALLTVRYGETISYGELARRVGNPKACRAVGMANNRNPISIIIPCHRIIGADGKLVGYGGGLEIKKFLLDLETQETE